jgi:hypothetical protein
MDASGRVGAIRQRAAAVAEEQGWVRDNKISTINNRTVYRDANGNYYSVDTKTGSFEMTNSRGIHQGELDMRLRQIDPPDPSGGHDLIVR